MIPVAMLAFLFLLFPTGYVRSRRWRLAAWFVGGAFALAAVLFLIVATASGRTRSPRPARQLAPPG